MTNPSPPDAAGDPGDVRVREHLLYGLSLPERALRSGAGMVAGTLRESAALLVPQAFQDSKTYCTLVRQTLDFLAEDVGGVARAESAEARAKVENFVARKAVGNFVDLAALATLHISPMLVLAVLSDVAYGSQAYLNELAGELKRKGVIDANSTIDHVDDLLTAVAGAAKTTATALDTPPLSADGLKATIDQTRAAVAQIEPAKLVPQAEVQRLWDDIHEIAGRQGVDPLTISGAMTLYSLDKIGNMGRGALSTVSVACALLDRHVLGHYAAALRHIQERGLYASLAQTSQPYIAAVWENFSGRKTTVTEDVVTGRLFARVWRAIRRWLGGSQS